MYFVLLALHPLTQQVFLAHTIPIHIKTETKNLMGRIETPGVNEKRLKYACSEEEGLGFSTGIHYPVYSVNPAPHACLCIPI